MTEIIKPTHIAIIMDGNGRWAKKRGLPRTAGHKAGEKSVVDVIERCYEEGIPYLSLYAFSTENWSRSTEEVSAIFNLLAEFMVKFGNKAIEKGIRVRIMGDISPLKSELKQKITEIECKTENFTRLTVNIGINYGGRAELARAFNLAIKDGKTELSEGDIKKYLYTFDIPDPDLLIRTGGEKRISNFMIYQSTYSELYFTDVFWPDFDGKELDKAVKEFSTRERRYGKAE